MTNFIILALEEFLTDFSSVKKIVIIKCLRIVGKARDNYYNIFIVNKFSGGLEVFVSEIINIEADDIKGCLVDIERWIVNDQCKNMFHGFISHDIIQRLSLYLLQL